MKKAMKALLAMGSMMMAVSGMAAVTADLTITVTPVGTKSVALSQASLDFGSLNVATVDNISSSVTVTNDGNIVESLGLRIKTADGVWSSGAAAGADMYNLRALFNSALPLNTDFAANDDVVTQALPVVATGLGGVYSGNQNALAVPAAGANTRGLWFKLDMPTTTTVSTVRTFVVEVSAN
jgi:hypothetical protein